MIVAVIGSRSIKHVDIGKILPEGTTELISGGANGVDSLAADYAAKHNLPIRVLRPDYDRYFYNRAPLERNQLIVDAADFVVAVWDGTSTGTKDAVIRAQKAGKPVCIYSPDGALLFQVSPDQPFPVRKNRKNVRSSPRQKK